MKAPVEFQLFKYGENPLDGEEPVVVDQESMDSIISEAKWRGNDIVVDYEHKSIGDTEAPAAGWISKFIDKGREGLWAAVTWTARAKAYLEGGEYRYFSPVFHYRKADKKVMRVLSVALTNTPRLNSLNPIVAKASPQIMSADQQRLNEMMGISTGDFIEYAGSMGGAEQLFETDEEKINRLLPTS